MDLCVLFVLALKKNANNLLLSFITSKKECKVLLSFFLCKKSSFFSVQCESFFTEKNQYNFLRLWWGSSFASAIHVLFVCMCVADFSLVTYNHICENFFRLSFHAAFSIDCNQSLFCPTSDNKKSLFCLSGLGFLFFSKMFNAITKRELNQHKILSEGID